MAPGSTGTEDLSAKHLFDRIGKIVHDQVKKGDAKDYIGELKGNLQRASGSEETVSTNKTCDLVKQYYERANGSDPNRYPCKKDTNGKDGEDVNRFSDTLGGQCTDHRIKGNDRNNTGGACAPFRRLNLCNKNLENINNNSSSSAKHDLLAEVCFAAKYEGDSIKSYHDQHHVSNPDSQLCTELARSFADIGDIVRGNDLYLGYDEKEKQRRKQLEQNLQKIFKEIYNNLNGAQDRYKDTENYYDLREDWWTANRTTIWEAITCSADTGNKYFHATCHDNRGESTANKQCRCPNGGRGRKAGEVNIVPTYFDYVPQYLRWFEEWAEDFCRKKKHKLQKLEKECRDKGEDGNQRYCSGNGYDCTKTIYKKGKLVVGSECTNCSIWCRMYETWIDNQKKEFLKQKRKYQTEISGGGSGGGASGAKGSRNRKKRGARFPTASNYDGYERKFYEKLQNDGYKNVNAFLDLLNNEKECKKITDGKEKIHFKTADNSLNRNKNEEGTFYHSQYCEVCPGCGVKRNGDKWEEKKNGNCDGDKHYNIKPGATPTNIDVLSLGDKRKDIETELKRICDKLSTDSENQELFEKWKCYKEEDIIKHADGEDEDEEEDEVSGAGGLCTLENKKKKEQKEKSLNKSEYEPEEFQKTFNDFFYFWIRRFLNDSMYWRGRVHGCIDKSKSEKCRSGCKDNCDCFLKWIGKKKTEWKKIVQHFNTQDGFKDFPHYLVLEQVLKIDDLLTNIKSGYGDAKELKGIREMLEKEKKINEEEAGASDGKDNTTIDKLLQHEGDEANKCKEKQEDCNKRKEEQEARGRGRSETGTPPVIKKEESESESDSEESGDEENENEEAEEEEESITEQDGSATEEETTKKDDNVEKVCQIVGDALQNNDNLTQACKIKYDGKHYGWKCIPTENTSNDATSDGNEATGNPRNRRSLPDGVSASDSNPTSNSGAVCIPPRRRKLYIKKIQEWAENTQLQSQEAGAKVSDSGPNTVTDQKEALRNAFIECAAVETFFLWDRYKKLNTKTPQDGAGPLGLDGPKGAVGGGDDGNSIFNSNSKDMKALSASSLGKDQLQLLQQEQQQQQHGHQQGQLLTRLPVLPPTGPIPPLPGLGENSNLLNNLLGTGSIPGAPGALGTSPVPGLSGEDSSHSGTNDGSPDSDLLRGNIPLPFLRQMFYTLGDYRDILVGNVPDGIDEVITSDKDKEGEGSVKVTMQELQQKIKSVIENSGNKHSPNGKPQSPSGDKPSEWWNEHAPSIWEGMICALTYTDNSETQAKGPDGTNKLTQDKDQYSKLLAKLESGQDYHYSKVVLKDEPSGTEGPKSTTTSQPPTLKEFTSRPTYFRYLEEWGEEFCKKRTEMLEKIKDGCKVEDGRRGNEKVCSGYGEDCKDELPEDATNFPSLECPRCATSCSSYKEWIKKKRTEYDKQKEIYIQQKTGAERNKDDKQFCVTQGTCNDAAAFLNSLKIGACSKNDDDSKKDNKIDFNNQGKTFGHENYCDPCSKFKIDCNNSHCKGDTENECTNNKITAENIKDIIKNTDINMLVSDDSKKQFDSDLSVCQNAGIFKGIRKDVWKCGKVCGYDVCKPKTLNGETVRGKENGENQIIQIRALVTHWVHNFLYDYNKIKHKISHCIRKGEEPKCIKHCDKKCKCVGQWISMKKVEWQQIKERFLNQYKMDSDEYYPVRSILEGFQSQTEFQNAIKSCDSLDNFKKSCGLNSDKPAQNGKEGTPKDIVDCMLNKLQQKVKTCPGKPSGSSEQQCQEPHPEEEEPEQLEEDDDKKVDQPGFCPEQSTKEEEKDEDGCEPAADEKEEEKQKEEPGADSDTAPTESPTEATDDSTSTDLTDQNQAEGNPEQTPVLKPEEEAPAPEVNQPKDANPPDSGEKAKPPKRQQPKRKIVEDPLLIPAMALSTLAWSVGIGFAALTYWLLKKKTKSSVDMLRVLQIPQNDYGMPTTKSSNSYIPYKSAQYRGKRYIYLEGDSSGDEKYEFMSDTTDITSSESEYEEFDINDIYAPGSPKYKTLIEVVLEPSKRNTENDIQSDIQNDDIPSSDTPSNKFTDNEWNQLKKDFISNMLQNEPNDLPNDYTSGNIPLNTQPKILRDNMEEKPFIMSIHDRNLLSGEEYNYDMTTNSGENNLYTDIYTRSGSNDSYSGKNDPTSDNRGPISGTKGPYSGIDLINDTLSGNQPIDIYDEMLKRKENELFGTNHVKQTSIHSVAKNTNSDPIMNQLDLFHKWLDRNRDMCEKWDKNNKVDILNQLKEEWENDNNNNSGNKTLNTDVSIEIDMNNPKTTNEFSNMDTYPNNSSMDNILDDMEKYNEPYYYIYYDVNDDKTSVNHINMDYNKMDNNNSDVPTKVQIEMNIVNNKKEIFEEEYPMSDIWNI
ncbi:erythrocyte membrane protein 1, PfEMP1, putative [Plasmodium reichenowi]|uniref:Erythrocyte membrane protein 1, PfEMP1, putative n=1 Tax=Plasmodium reichenowi TaxID=5854 RepID=A0A2P9D7L2_PLARE|nr:erythrocyte membrane protein 1, PfEMP1, putative [Plasmodium reichenowi]